MFGVISLATTIAGKLKAANPPTKARIMSFIALIKEKGVIPLGLGKDATGKDAYWWVVYDASKFPSNDALMEYLEGRSPPGYTVAVMSI